MSPIPRYPVTFTGNFDVVLVISVIRLYIENNGFLKYIEADLPANEPAVNAKQGCPWSEYFERSAAQKCLTSSLPDYVNPDDLEAEGWNASEINPKDTYQKFVKAILKKAGKSVVWLFQSFTRGVGFRQSHHDGKELVDDLQSMKDAIASHIQFSAEISEKDYLDYALRVMSNKSELGDLYRETASMHDRGFLTWGMLMWKINDHGRFTSRTSGASVETVKKEDYVGEWEYVNGTHKLRRVPDS